MNRPNGIADARSWKNEDQAGRFHGCLGSCGHHRQKVMIFRDDGPAKFHRTLQVSFVGRPEKAFVLGGDHIDLPAPQTRHDAVIHALVRVQIERHLALLGRAALVALRAQARNERSRLLPLGANHVLVVVVVGERGMNVRERQVRVRLDDFIGSHPSVLDLARDLADLDVRSGHDRPPTGVIDSRWKVSGWFHGSS